MRYYGIDPEHRRLDYIRYVDDFLMGFIGPKKAAQSLLIKIAHFLDMQLKMQLHVDKTGVTHHKKGTMLLGYKIFGHYDLNVK